MNDLEQRLTSLMHDSSPTPPFELDAAQLRASADARRRQHRVRLGAAAGAIAITVAVATTASILGDSTPARPTAQHQSTNYAPNQQHSTSNQNSMSNQARTKLAEEQALDQLELPRGARRIANTSKYQPPFMVGLPNLVDTPGTWLVAASLDSVKHFLLTHQPPHTTPPEVTKSGGATGQSTVLEYYLVGPWSQPDIFSDFELQLTLIDTGKRTAVRADAIANWLPRRTSEQVMPENVVAVDITRTTRSIGSSRPSTTHWTAGRAAARMLATDLNGLHATTIYTGSCPLIRDAATTTLAFRAAGVVRTVQVDESSCRPVVHIGSGPPLAPSAKFLHDVKHAR